MSFRAIEVVSDVVCPWCFIGKRRLEKSLALLGRPEVAVHWQPFQLNPNAPPEGMDRQAYRIRKFGSLEYSQQLEARVAAAGAEEDIEFRFDRIRKTPNTLEAHRLVWLAGRDSPGLQNTIVENLFRAYFIDGADVGDLAVLKRIGVENGIDPRQVDECFAAQLGSQELAAAESAARAQGVDGVPSFFVQGEPVASGAQKPELLAAALRHRLS